MYIAFVIVLLIAFVVGLVFTYFKVESEWKEVREWKAAYDELEDLVPADSNASPKLRELNMLLRAQTADIFCKMNRERARQKKDKTP